ncbi:hypothetical protein [Paenibacillus sp. NEAU-GSW1]|uniref:hypothetical protein n=1 Tax=Paenibacillus sp. NEAU-GSW1 TaxID=2682486 RepID=UPI0012E2D7D7|nr:hypothetical protein [Paenibacillus sp. NEAU-GSW1]MUT68325.1 hypothetical protein [Paenibacillus sp. NEAU-GSW1]
MNNIKKVLLYTLVILLIGFGTYLAFKVYVNLGPRNAHYLTVKTTHLDQESIGNLSLNQSINDLKPTPNADKNNSLFEYYTWENETKFATNFNDDKIIRIIVYKSSSFSTSKGIQVGDSKEKIIHAYGNNFYKRVEQGFDIMGYVDKNLNRTIEFWLTNDNNIYSIRLDKGSMD